MAVSGIDHTIKIFSPDAKEQRNARKGIGVQSADPGVSSLGFGRRRRAQRASDSAPPREPTSTDEEDDEVATNGLRSRKAMHDQYKITSQNDMDRKGGREDAFITVGSFLPRLRIRADMPCAESVTCSISPTTPCSSSYRRRGRGGRDDYRTQQ